MFNAQNNILSFKQYLEVNDYGNIGKASYLYKSAESRPSFSSKKNKSDSMDSDQDSDDDDGENMNISDERLGP